jgi:hypothetical protein
VRRGSLARALATPVAAAGIVAGAAFVAPAAQAQTVNIEATLSGMQLDVGDAEVVATPAGSSTPVVLLDVTGDITTSVTPGTTSTTDTYDSDQLVIDPAGATYLDRKLHASAFKAGQTVGTLSATWTVVYPS